MTTWCKLSFIFLLVIPLLTFGDDKEDWIMQPANGRMPEDIKVSIPVPMDDVLIRKLDVISKRWKAGTPKPGAPETLDEARMHLWEWVNMIGLPALCIEHDDVFYFSGWQFGWRETDFSSGLAIRKGNGTIYSWHGINWSEEFPKGPHPAKVVARLGEAVFKNRLFPSYLQNTQPTNAPVVLGDADYSRFMDWVLERQKEKALRKWRIGRDRDALYHEWREAEKLPPEKFARYLEAMRMIKLKPERVDLIDERFLQGTDVEGWPWVGDMRVVDASVSPVDDGWLRTDSSALSSMKPQMERLLLARKLRAKVTGEASGGQPSPWQKWMLWCLEQVKSAEIVFEDTEFQKNYESYLKTVEKHILKRASP